MPLPINIAIEGATDEVIVRRVLMHVGLNCGLVRGRSGKAHLLRKLPNYNQAAGFAKWLVVVDLDQDADCAPTYIRDILSQPPTVGMLLRISVRAVEAWLLADSEHLAAFLGISAAKFPRDPDAEVDPKRTLLDLAQRSRQKELREDIVPRPGSGGRVGPGYLTRIGEFIAHPEYPWRPEIAAEHSDSLQRCLAALHNWQSTDF